MNTFEIRTASPQPLHFLLYTIVAMRNETTYREEDILYYDFEPFATEHSGYIADTLLSIYFSRNITVEPNSFVTHT